MEFSSVQFIVLGCTKNKKIEVFKANGEEAQRKPLGL